MNTIKNRKSRVYQWVLVIIVLFYSGSAYSAFVNSFYASLKYGLTLGIGAYALWKKSGHVPLAMGGRTTELWIPAIWSVLVALSWFVHNDTEGLTDTISRVLHMCLVFEVVCLVRWEDFKEKYVQIMVVIAAISLFFFWFAANTGLYKAVMPMLRGYNASGRLYNKYQGFLFYFTLDKQRNSGPFWEPGIFATYIVGAILLMPYIQNRKLIWLRYAVLIVALITTSSSAGYVLLILAFLCNMLNRIEIRTQRDVPKVVMIVLAGIALIYCYFNLELIFQWLGLSDNMIYSKILSAGESQRAISVSTNWKAFLESPLIGHGYSGLGTAEAYQGRNLKDIVLNTASTFRLLAALGIGGSLFTVMLVVGVFRQKHLAWYTKALLSCVALIIINKEGHDHFVIGWCLILYLNSREIRQNDYAGGWM